MRMHLKNLIMYTSGLTEEYERALDEILDPIHLWVEVHKNHEFKVAGELPHIVKQSWDYYKKIKIDMERNIRL